MFPGLNLRCLHGEGRLRGVTGVEELPVGLPVGNELYPLDPVLLLHGVGNASHGHLVAALDLLDDGDVLLLRRVD